VCVCMCVRVCCETRLKTEHISTEKFGCNCGSCAQNVTSTTVPSPSPGQPPTHHFLRGEGVHPLLDEALHVVLREGRALLLLLEADEARGVPLLPLHQLLLRVGRRALGPVAAQALLQVPAEAEEEGR